MPVDRERFERNYRDHDHAELRYCLRRCGREDGLDAATTMFMVTARLKETSSATPFDALPGGHNVADYLPEVVAYLLDVTGTS